MFEQISSETAFRTSMRNKVAVQPKKDSDDPRLGTFASPAFRPTFSFNSSEPVFTMGSCFARVIENHLQAKGYCLPVMKLELPQSEIAREDLTPRSTLNKYSPFAMLNELEGALGKIPAEECVVEVGDGKYLDLQLHSPVPVSFERAVERRQMINEINRSSISKSRVVIITLGLVECWFDSLVGRYTNQMPPYQLTKKQPERFFFEVLSPEKVFDAVDRIIILMKEIGKDDQKILLTVSPVPIVRTFTNNDVIVANSYSKSVLRVAAEIAERKYDHIDYYPSYESVINSSHDAAWLDDRVHVSNAMARHNAERMISAYESAD